MTFPDAGVSGSNGLDTRQGIYEALSAISEGHAEVLVIKNLDRLARKLTIQEAVLAKVWDHGGKVWSIEDGGWVLEDDPDDPIRTAMRQMRGVFAQLERGMIVKRMRDGKRHKAERGGYTGGRPPFGWRSQDGSLVQDDAEQAALKVILGGRSADPPRSYRDLCAELMATGHPAPGGGSQWHPIAAQRIAARGVCS